MIPAAPFVPLVTVTYGAVVPPPPIPPPPPVYNYPAPTPPAGVVGIIPTDASTPQIPPYNERIALSGKTYGLDFTWNSRAQVWTMNVLDADGNPVATSAPLRNGIGNANWATTVPGFPAGRFFTRPVDNNPADAAQDQLGTRVLLAYFTPAGG